ncbi:MAG: hypothetical protein NC123_00355 [Butyrivibrio sp.]|nr:hypothetical protein [Acetatifactor muris]MCM1557986.1 hypothetical protein [Butyrivibrio sp.]
MKDVNTERKLQLIQQIRSRYKEDRYDMGNRERILYGRESVRPWEENGDDPAWEQPPQSSFRLRVLLAVLLFAAVVALDTNGTSVLGITAEKVYQIISADYEEKIEAWVETLSR